jgi:DNA polymerase-1
MNCTSPEAYDLLHEGALALAQVENNGIRIDVDYVKRTREEVKKDCAEKEVWMRKHDYWSLWRKRYGQKASLGSSDQLSTLLYKDLKYDITNYTKSGKASTDRTALETIDDPFVRVYTEWSELMKANGTFLAGIERETIKGLLRPFYNLHIAKTYRSSSEAPNFQNFPVRNPLISKLIRSAFIPREGRRLVEIDYGGIEVKVAACYHKDPTMLSYIHDPTKDMHRDMAAEIYLCGTNQVNKMLRYVAKNRYVFPEFYGSYWEQVGMDLWKAIDLFKMTIDKGEESIPVGQWLERKGINGMDEFLQHVKRVEENFWGQRFAVYDHWRKDWYSSYLNTGGYRTLTGFYIQGLYRRNDVINHPVQGSAFHCLLWSLIQINKELRKRKMKSMIVGQIHDSIVGDVVDKEFDDYIEICDRIMTKTIRKHWKWIIVPLEIEAEACQLGETWFDKKKVELN